MSLQKLSNYLTQCNGKVVTVLIVGGISIPYVIENCEFHDSEHFLFFGENLKDENFPFQICKEDILDVKFLDGDVFHVKVNIQNGEYITDLFVSCDEVKFENGGSENE